MPDNLPRGVELPEDLKREVPTDNPALLKAFLAGVDPRGTVTMGLGHRTEPKHWGTMQALGVGGGLLGGSLVVPGILGGIAGLIPALIARKGPAALWQATRRGATDIYGKVWSAMRAAKALRRAAAGGRAATDIERGLIEKAIHRNVTLGDILSRVSRRLGNKISPWKLARQPEIKRVKQMIAAGRKLDPESVKGLQEALDRGYARGLLAIGGAGGVTGYSAYKQYNLGQKARKARQQAREDAREAFGRGAMAGKYSSARLCLIKRALEQYDPVPFSGLTAKSDFIANRKHAPKEPNPLTKEEQERLGVLYENSSKSSQRVVDAHRRGRTTLTA